MSGEKKRLDNMQGSALSSAQPPSSGEDSPQQQAKYLKDLKSELQNLYEKKVRWLKIEYLKLVYAIHLYTYAES